MSGGSMGYVYSSISDQAAYLADRELIELAKDVSNLFHDAEWWHSCDIDESDYRKTAQTFKDKWLRGNGREERLRGYINEIFNDAKRECLTMLGDNKDAEQPLSRSYIPSRKPDAAFSVMGKVFYDEESLKWLADAVKEKMERE